MLDLKQIKLLLRAAGISKLKAKIDTNNEAVKFDYVFRGKPDKKVITFREIENVLSIGEQSPSMSIAQRAGCVLDTRQELE